jgi:hypothetical protein
MQFQFLHLTQIWEIQNKLTKLFHIIFLVVWRYGCTTNHSPGMKRKIWGNRLILSPWPGHCGFCVSSPCNMDKKDTARRSHRPVHEFTKPVTQRFQVQLATAYADTKVMCCY